MKPRTKIILYGIITLVMWVAMEVSLVYRYIRVRDYAPESEPWRELTGMSVFWTLFCIAILWINRRNITKAAEKQTGKED